jgi:hypothetical protein
LAPSHVTKQPAAQESMSHLLPALQALIEHPPPVHAPTRQAALSPLHSRLQPPEQPTTAHVAP